MSFSVLAKRNGAELNVLNGACANVACPNVFCPDGFCGDGFCIENARILFVTFPRWIPTLIHAIR